LPETQAEPLTSLRILPYPGVIEWKANTPQMRAGCKPHFLDARGLQAHFLDNTKLKGTFLGKIEFIAADDRA
jgi:hypothetical protein